jgi:hypothetical protein
VVLVSLAALLLPAGAVVLMMARRVKSPHPPPVPPE